MQPFTTLTAIAAPIDEPNVDTNQLCPTRFNKVPRGPRHAQILFHDRRFDAEVGLRLPAKSATEQSSVHGDMLERNAESLGDQVASGLRRLEAAPYFAFAFCDARGCCGRFH